MKLLIAVIRPEQLPAVKQALFDSQIQHLTATTVMGTAPKSEQQMYRGVQREVSLFRRVRVEVAVNDAELETAIDAISRGAHETGGWGRIMVQPLEDIVTIWTGVRGPRAL
ncbi:MAG: P-II family nitrogen regulator [Planctomycetota bacterium]|jgi:nitrogen regulatory protein P-II 1/nitrogen regulatory protein P-II 2